MRNPEVLTMTHARTPVLIVGGGLAGLTAALLLGWRGISCLLVERRGATSRHPRARGVNLRSLELLRAIPGLEEDLKAANAATEGDFTIVIAESVTGQVFKTLVAPGMIDTRLLSPALTCTAGQDRVEPILLRHARRMGADIRFGTELTSFTQDSDGVQATLRDRATGAEMLVGADYLIAADGHRSPVREALGIDVGGRGTLSHNMSILFQADLSRVVRPGSFVLYYLRNRDFTGAFVSTDDPAIGQVSVEYDPEKHSADDFDTKRCEQLVRAALGIPDLEMIILDVMPWEMSARLAERMAAERVFLAGDAAHTMPPTGGLGGQTAMQDAADLAWKLALVLTGQAGPGLLATYEAERHPVAAMTVARQTANYVERLRPDRAELADSDAEADYVSIAMGYRYRSAGVIADEGDDGRATENPLHPTGRPGTRLAHVAVTLNGREVSTLDIVGRGFVLLAGSEGCAWMNAVRGVTARSGMEITAHQLGADLVDRSGGVMARTVLASRGALLVRPDGFIAWRSAGTETDPPATLAKVLARVLFRDDAAALGAA
jgi:putative polyketide hydroxylase